jgi:hypothetical protein
LTLGRYLGDEIRNVFGQSRGAFLSRLERRHAGQHGGFREGTTNSVERCEKLAANDDGGPPNCDPQQQHPFLVIEKRHGILLRDRGKGTSIMEFAAPRNRDAAASAGPTKTQFDVS